MKTQRRTFVVEVKSRGRRSATQPDSIWGNMDLKAFARQAESDAPQLFDPAVESAPVDQVVEIQSEPAQANEPATHLDDAAVSPVVPVEDQAERIEPTTPVSQPEKLPTMKRSRQTARRARETAADKPVDLTEGVAATSAQIETPADDVVILGAENQRLKALLFDHLRQQNRQLRQMLERFDAV